MNIFLECSIHFMRKKDSKWPNFSAFVSILGIAFGVLSFLTVVTILDAFQTQMKNIISSVNPNLTIFSPMGISDFQNVEKKISSLMDDKISHISPFVYQESILAYQKQTSAVYIRGIPGTDSSSAQDLSTFIYPKDALSTLNTPKSPHTNVILGKTLSEVLGASIGSTVTLMTFETKPSTPPNTRYTKLVVSGILDVGLAQYDKQYMLINFDAAANIFGSKNWASGFEIKLKNPDKALDIATEFSQQLPYSIVAWQEIDASLFHQISRDSTVIKFIVFIISIVGAFNIVITLGLTVMNRSKQIALLRCLGAQRRQIMTIFIGMGGILGFFGACVGTLLSTCVLFILANIPLGDLNQFYYLDKIPVKFDLTLTIYVFLAAIGLSFLGALYPAWRATKVSPITGLNY